MTADETANAADLEAWLDNLDVDPAASHIDAQPQTDHDTVATRGADAAKRWRR